LLTKGKAEPAGARGGSGAETAAGEGGRKTSLLFEVSLLSTAVFLGTNPVAVKYAVGYIPPMPFVTMRFVLAGLVLWALLRFTNPEGRLERKDLWAMAGLGLVGIAMNNMLFTNGVSMTSASNSALVVATAPLWGMLLAFVLGWERPSLKGIVGVGVALLGVAVIVYRGLGASGTSLPGDLLVMGAAACWGSYAVLSLPLLKRYSPLAVATYSMLRGSGRSPVRFPATSGRRLGGRELGRVGSLRLLGALGGSLRVHLLAARDLAHRGQPHARLPVPGHPGWRRRGRRALQRGLRDRQGYRRSDLARRRVPRPPPVSRPSWLPNCT
jgi:drug/metabolite transporter (DMT)-like permease